MIVRGRYLIRNSNSDRRSCAIEACLDTERRPSDAQVGGQTMRLRVFTTTRATVWESPIRQSLHYRTSSAGGPYVWEHRTNGSGSHVSSFFHPERGPHDGRLSPAPLLWVLFPAPSTGATAAKYQLPLRICDCDGQSVPAFRVSGS